MSQQEQTNTVIIGAGAAGLACSAYLTQSRIPHIVLDKGARIGDVWRQRYDRLHLHTTKTSSQLPLLKMPGNYPAYVSKDQFANYLQRYAATLNLQPRLNEKVTEATSTEGAWRVNTTKTTFSATHLIIATGLAATARKCTWKGLESFRGPVLHSTTYTTGQAFRGKKVLVVGFGNSACEIALCLHENGARPTLSVKSCVNVLPRDILGISIVDIARVESWLNLSPELLDAVNRTILRMIRGKVTSYGLQECRYGPLTQIVRRRKIPVLDIGTLRLIRQGKLNVFPQIEEVGEKQVTFADGRKEEFDAIILGTGFDTSISQFLRHSDKVCTADGVPLKSGTESLLPGLFFCGFHLSSTGMLHEIGTEARSICKIISAKERHL